MKDALDRDAFIAGVHEEWGKIQSLMKETWGEAPDVQVTVEPMLVVSADFNIKDFAHKGRKIYVTRRQAEKGRRDPKHVAREIAKEITAHRNTCQEGCGVGGTGLWVRAYSAGRVLRGMDSTVWEESVNGEQKQRAIQLKYLQPADSVERYLEPVRAKRIDKAREIVTDPKKHVPVLRARLRAATKRLAALQAQHPKGVERNHPDYWRMHPVDGKLPCTIRELTRQLKKLGASSSKKDLR